MPIVTSQEELCEFLEKVRVKKELTHNALMMDTGQTSRTLLDVMIGRTKFMRVQAMFSLVAVLGLEIEVRFKPSAKSRRIAAAKASRGQDEPAVLTDNETGDQITIPRDVFDRIRAEVGPDWKAAERPPRRLASVA